ncbi:helix-turn-helix domain-containing protein [Pseudonocardia hispaniensis]|uniref:Helix-turn-helix domain-containing protein n=1 Tax=Pseudonocardia hispaniensis TaxID=904933 RepID=A0ABW1J5G7_9PSEU
MSQTENEDHRAIETIIAHQVRGYRRARGVSITELARHTGISKAMLSKIENAQTSCSLSTLSRLANVFEVPVTALLRGADAEHEAVYVPAGHGAQIVRRGSNVGHLYHQLGTLRGQHKRIEPLLVTLSEATEVFPMFEHPGTEFIYMLEGSMVYVHRGAQYKMRPGDALQFDGEGPHGPVGLIELPVRFLSVIAYGHIRTE